MLSKAQRINICLSVFLAVFLCASVVYAGGIIDGSTAANYLNAPAVGESVIGYMIGEYLGPDATYIHIFVRRCECLKRLTYTSEGVLVTYVHVLTAEEFNALGPDTLLGMVDSGGQLTAALASQTGLIGIVDQILEYKKDGNRFAARVGIKFVAQ
jgi:hypothetical protein